MTDEHKTTSNATSSDPRPADELILLALAVEDDDNYWEFVDAIRIQGTRDVFEKAKTLCKSDDPDERQLGAQIITQFGTWSERPFLNECLEIAYDILEHEENPYVLNATAQGLGYLHPEDDPRIIELLVRLKDHPDENVRYGVVKGLLSYKDESAVAALIQLSSDKDEDVRNWATFGLGLLDEIDDPEISEALLRRLDDPYDAVRGEALRGLADRGDGRVIEPLIHELETIADADEWWDYAFEAAVEMRDTRLYPALVKARESGIDDSQLDRAIALCRIPLPDEDEVPDDQPTTCPVCGLRDAFKKPGEWEDCVRCGWTEDSERRADPDNYDDRLLNQERERWKKRIELGKESNNKTQ